MILVFTSRARKEIALLLLLIFYSEFMLSAYASVVHYASVKHSYERPQRKWLYRSSALDERLMSNQPSGTPEQAADKAKAFLQEENGPTQPEMQAFQSVGANNMVDLFSGDFSYNIPLMDVGGYPVNISYRSGVAMEEEASWVGLGFNINPGTINRSLRGLPDDFDGRQDSVAKTVSIRPNRTIGVSGGIDVELKGKPIVLNASLGVFHNTYNGWGMETGLNASINAGSSAKGPYSGGLSLTNNSQQGLSIIPSFQYQIKKVDEEGSKQTTFGLSLPYNSRMGLKGLQLSAGVKMEKEKDGKSISASSTFSSLISFSRPSYTPTMSYPMSSYQYSFTAKLGGEITVVHPTFFVSGYVSSQKIDDEDKRMVLPAFGYLNAQHARANRYVLHDFNREKDMPYREKPAVPNIAIPSYTYDVFSITGEGSGGMFRGYRGDIGFVHDNLLTSKDASNRFSVDVGAGWLAHGGLDLNLNRATTTSGPWTEQNEMSNTVAYRPSEGLFEASYFRNPGEKAVNAKDFYSALGDDDVVAVNLAQNGNSDPSILATNYLNRYRNGASVGQSLLNSQNAIRNKRDKRAQVISYLTAAEASEAGTGKYIENYALNKFTYDNCNAVIDDWELGKGQGLEGSYFSDVDFKNPILTRNDATINFSNYRTTHEMGALTPFPSPIAPTQDFFSIRWTGRIKAPVTGTYQFRTFSDDGARIYINDSLILQDWNIHGETTNTSVALNLEAGKFYDIRVEYFQWNYAKIFILGWSYPGRPDYHIIPTEYLYHRSNKDKMAVNDVLTIEKRVNNFRKPSHISQVNVLNPDGRRYVYGIPVYNLKQKDVSFSVNASGGDIKTGLVKYDHGTDNSVQNNQGKEAFFSQDEIPAYAHGFLLTGVLSPDYVDATGDGITEDDLGDAVKFNYSKVAGIENPLGWRAPYVEDSASYNEGFRSYNRDDKGNYTYGTKELWYLNSIVSKTMVATFKVSDRKDGWAIAENGRKDFNNKYTKKLDEINLYTKADYLKNGVNATPVKTVHFEYSYELCRGVSRGLYSSYADSGKLTLKSIWFTYNGNKKDRQNPYYFHYSPTNPKYNNHSVDRWGVYKSSLQNPLSTANNLITNAEYPFSIQDSVIAAQNAAAWTLDSIGLPSGGKIKVTYESDDYAYVQNKRAMRMFRVKGFSNSTPTSMASITDGLYSGSGDNLYVIAEVTQPVTSVREVYTRYLEGNEKLYFKTNVQMPSDTWGKGFEYVPCYAGIDLSGGYGFLNSTHIWFKMKSIDKNGMEGKGDLSPLAKAAIQFLRLNLPSKAYPDSEVMNDVDVMDAVMSLFGIIGGLYDIIQGFDNKARSNSWARKIDNTRSFVRLNCPDYFKYGGGVRVKRITIHDNWNKMSKGKKDATYGQEYDYTTVKEINGVATRISSGVACYEPFIGGEENPFRLPVEYLERVAPLAPVNMGYTEEPLGECFYPAPSVGYSKVRVKSIHSKNVKSADGYSETEFYTAYEFPTITERSVLNDNKKRFSPALINFLKVYARNYVNVTQGFKVELNDMHGKLKSEASYAVNNDLVSQTINYYKTEPSGGAYRKLNNTVSAISPTGKIDTAALIGKDIELMMDMRSEKSISQGINFSPNIDLFSIGFWPVVIPTLLNLYQRDETVFRSIGTTKIIQRNGILDSIVHIEKGSRIKTSNLLYDSETGDVILSSTQNEFNDSVFNFNYPAHWRYEGMGGAYKNIDVVINNVFIKSGKITSGISLPDSVYFTGGDEVLIASRQKTGEAGNCIDAIASFPGYSHAWVVNASEMQGGPKQLYFINRAGNVVTANGATIRIIRSGRRNIAASIGQITSLRNPLIKQGDNKYKLVFDEATKIINAATNEFRQNWKVGDQIKSKIECVGQ